MKIDKVKNAYNDYKLEISWGQLQAIKDALERDHAEPVSDELYAELVWYLDKLPGPGEEEEDLKARDEMAKKADDDEGGGGGSADSEGEDYPLPMPPGHDRATGHGAGGGGGGGPEPHQNEPEAEADLPEPGVEAESPPETEPEPEHAPAAQESLTEGGHKPGCTCGFCKNKGRFKKGGGKSETDPEQKKEPEKKESGDSNKVEHTFEGIRPVPEDDEEEDYLPAPPAA